MSSGSRFAIYSAAAVSSLGPIRSILVSVFIISLFVCYDLIHTAYCGTTTDPGISALNTVISS